MPCRSHATCRAGAPKGPHAARSTVAAATIIALFAGIAPSACTRVSETQRFPVVSERLTIARTIPEQGAVIARDAQLDFCFSDRVDPRALDDFDATLSGWAVDTTLDLRTYFHSASIEDGYNFGSYRDPEIDRLVDLARRVEQVEDGAPLLRQVQQILHRDQPYTFLWEAQRQDAVSRRLLDVRPNALSAFANLREWSVVRP